MKHYDVMVLGSGPGCSGLVYGLKKAGKNVAVVEKESFGGTCPNRGCDPKKVLYSIVEAIDAVENLQQKGFSSVPEVKWEDLMAYKDTFTSPVDQKTKQAFEEIGIDTIRGEAKFVSSHQIEVQGERYTSDQFVIATGRHPFIPDIPGKEYYQTSSDFLSLEHLPDVITFVGAGYISFELANIAVSSGSEVHLIHHNDRALKTFDAELVTDLIENLKKKGVHFHFDEEVKAIEKTSNGLELTLKQGKLKTDLVLAGLGRIANTDLDLEKAGVAYTKKGISVNAHLQTSSPNIYGLGDVLDKAHPSLTPVSGFEGRYLAQELINENYPELSYPLIPVVCFSSPKLAQVGISLPEAKEKGYTIQTIDMTSWLTYRRNHQPISKAKLAFDQDHHLRGVNLLSQDADSLINLFMIAMSEGWNHEKITEQIFAYPSVASDLTYLI